MATTDSLRSYRWQFPADGGVAPASASEDPTGASGGIVRAGFVGVGGMGLYNIRIASEIPGVVVTSICDVDSTHMDKAEAAIRETAGACDVSRFGDFRKLVRAPDVDVVIITTPDHWHALQSIEAMQCGKDVYVEKPLSLTVAEGRALCKVAEETGRVCQTGTQQRSSHEFRLACEMVRNGVLGDIEGVSVTIPSPNSTAPEDWQPMPVPETLDYDMWLGPAPWKAYHELRCHYSFRFISDYSGGQMTNWGAHVLDIVQWALGMDNSGPVQVEGRGVFPSEGLFDAAREVDIEWRYANGVRLSCRSGEPSTVFRGTKGVLKVGRGLLTSDPPELLEVPLGPDAKRLYRSDHHFGNFIDCVRTRKEPICPPEVGQRSATVCHIGNIAMKLGRLLQWDPEREQFVNDAEANAMLSRPMRAPWHLP